MSKEKYEDIIADVIRARIMNEMESEVKLGSLALPDSGCSSIAQTQSQLVNLSFIAVVCESRKSWESW
jgi:hypothetical protein